MCDGRHQVNVTGGADAIDGDAVNQFAAQSPVPVAGGQRGISWGLASRDAKDPGEVSRPLRM
jgi:hypothetical protein